MSQPWNANTRAAVNTILIVHPDPRLCELLQLALSSSGYDIRLSGDADEGIGQFRRVNPDLTLVNLALAIAQGNDFCEFLQGLRSGRRVPMIVISDLSPAETARQALTLNVEDFLSRPFRRRSCSSGCASRSGGSARPGPSTAPAKTWTTRSGTSARSSTRSVTRCQPGTAA